MSLLQDYIRDLEKEEDEQKKRQKVSLKTCSFSVFSEHISFDFEFVITFCISRTY